MLSSGLFEEVKNSNRKNQREENRIEAWAAAIEANYDVDCLTMYKTVDKKVKPQAAQLPEDAETRMQKASQEPRLRVLQNIGHVFTDETKPKLNVNPDGLLTKIEEQVFRDELYKRGKAFAFTKEEIGCVDPAVVTPLVAFTVPHTPWNYRPLSINRAHHEPLLALLQDRIRMKVLVPQSSPYSSRFFTVPKKNGTLRFIQDLQPANAVTIRSCAIGPPPDTFSEDFAGCSIYSMGDLFSGYDQFQLALESRSITAMRTPIGQVSMATVPMGGTNSVAHVVNGMHNVLRDFVPNLTFPFIDDLPIRGCTVA